MDVLIAIGFGIILGALTTCFMLGASRIKRENEIYMEGYLAGQVEALKE